MGEQARGALPADEEVVTSVLATGSSTAVRVRNLLRALRPDAGTRAALRTVDVLYHPFTVPYPRLPGLPRVLSLADVQHRDLPDLFSRAERAYRSSTYDAAARRADVVVTISEFSKGRIVEVLGIDPARVRVAQLGVRLPAVGGTGPREELVFCPAHVWPHKNHARLIEAMARLRESRPGLRLVLTGGGAESLGRLPAWVEDRGRVGADELASLYARAGCLAFPSLYEGFGLPVLEAMAAACPVAASQAGSIPEIAGDAAVLFDPYDVDAIARGIDEALGDNGVRVARGLERAARFTWSRCAEAHLTAYRRLVQEASSERGGE